MSNFLDSALNSVRAMFANFTQDTRLLRIHTAFGKDKLIVESFTGTETISDGFCFDVIVLCTDAHLHLSAPLGQPVLFEILTQHSRTAPRPIHGHVFSFELLSSDGGFARYRMRIEPWTAFMRYRYDSFIWQNQSVLDVIADVFSDYQGQAKISADYRIDVADPSHYPVQNCITQYEENHWNFVTRLLANAGLFFWFEHDGDVDSPSFGKHTLVIADNNAAFKPNQQSTIRYHRANATEAEDSITSWHSSRSLVTNSLSLESWNSAQVTVIGTQIDSNRNNGDVPVLTSTDVPGVGHFNSREEVERAAKQQMEALDARNKLYNGAATCRTAAPGTSFTLTQHAVHDASRLIGGDADSTFVFISVRHQGRNNLTSDVRTLLHNNWGNSTSGHQINDDEPLYQNHFTAIRADIPWRPLLENGEGVLLHQKPTVHGLQTATVVGVAGQDLTTNRDHMIKVQLHWQRGSQSSSRNQHPRNDNAPGNESAYVWVRVVERSAGANFGSSNIPRHGQEVLLDFLEGDIDRAVCLGTVYNGKGQEDAQGNQIAQGAGGATGNSPAWFPGSTGDHAHNAVMSGFKTQEIGHSQDGQGGYNALIMDDSTEQVGARLQSTQHTTQLNLGHIKRQDDNARQASHGHGAELTTEASGALRAGQGILLSADARQNASGSQMDAKEAHNGLQQALNLQQTMADTAAKHNAFVGKSLDKDQHGSPEKVLAKPIDSLAQTADGIGTSEGGGAGTVTAFGSPDIVMSAPGGTALLTPQDIHATASAITITGGQDVSATVGGNYVMVSRVGISFFTYGKAGAKRSDEGIKFHAAAGKFDMQAQSAELKAAADKDVNISSNAKIEIASLQGILLTAGGAFIKIADGGIQIHAPGNAQFKAGQKVLSGPDSMTYGLPSLPKGGEITACAMKAKSAAENGAGKVSLDS